MPRVKRKVETCMGLGNLPDPNEKVGNAMYFAGVDIAKRRHELCVIDDSGDILLQLPVENTKRGFEKLLTAFRTKQLTNQNVRFCLEATGHYWIALYCQLKEHGFSVDVVNPIQSDALRNLYIRKTKTDQKDSFILADLLRLGRATSTQLASETVLKLQTLSRMRFEFVSQIGGLKNKVIGILDRIFPEYPGCFSDVFIKTSRELLKQYSSPEELAEVDLTELSDFLREHSRGRIGMDRAERIQNLARGTFGISIAIDAFTLELRLLLQQIEFIEEQIKEIEDAIDQVMEEMRPSDETPYRHVIETIPGIGPVLAAAIIGEVGDITRFKNAKALVAFAALMPRLEHQASLKEPVIECPNGVRQYCVIVSGLPQFLLEDSIQSSKNTTTPREHKESTQMLSPEP